MIEITNAIIELQGKLEPVHKDAKGNWGKYATLTAVQEEVLPKLKECGLAVVQPLSNLDGLPAIRTTLLHQSGESITEVTPLILPKNDPQGQGSAVTYARRYSLASMLGLVIDDDDDGQRATDKVKEQGSYKPSPNKRASPKQIEYITTLFKDKYTEQTKDDMLMWALDEGVEFTTMTSEQASALIETLKEGK